MFRSIGRRLRSWFGFVTHAATDLAIIEIFDE